MSQNLWEYKICYNLRRLLSIDFIFGIFQDESSAIKNKSLKAC